MERYGTSQTVEATTYRPTKNYASMARHGAPSASSCAGGRALARTRRSVINTRRLADSYADRLPDNCLLHNSCLRSDVDYQRWLRPHDLGPDFPFD